MPAKGAACSRGPAASDRRPVLATAMAFAAAANIVTRTSLAWQMRRTSFHSAGEHSPFLHLRDLPTVHRTLTPDNLRAALLASGSIPLLMEGERIPGAPGVYRDGGIADYHLDLDYGPGPGAEPMRRWQTIPDASAALGDELHDLIETGRLVDAVVPWA